MNYIILDDEPLARKGIELELNNIPDLHHKGSFAAATDAMACCNNTRIDLLFLDIEMPDCNGFEFLDTLPRSPIVIFTTAYPQYAVESYNYHAIDYLLKPLKKTRLLKAVQKAIHYHQLLYTPASHYDISQLSADYIVIRTERKYRRIMLADICFIEGLKDYVMIHTTTQPLLASMNIKTICNSLPPAHFARVSKSYLVNLRHIDAMDHELIYINTNEIPLSATYREEILEKWLNGHFVKR
ncbi:LytTR family DNA-binding domain-containing protein [Chitinophaga pendula]|uniref:LytR/AlgR family response regulator transcription factor n=1 Tax=Chitinophaga TaxID=79328 RepID=UPI000BAFABD4|nr:MULTISPECIES: LytTR family DNA-binding domain-containing protein [Chitinophaga]ASZ12940.1 DNA-binding response regulator [Chitinophaga sp. MD30]UCJ09431.1 LytTR family DNA-binding domain-containing protein [Chitinophaga pendula]